MTPNDPAIELVAVEVRGLARAQQATLAELVILQSTLQALPDPLAIIMQDAATQQGARTAELVGKIKSDIGQVLAAMSTQNAFAPPTASAASKPKLRLGSWLSVAALVGCGSSAMATGVVLTAILGIGQPLSPGADRQMATYVWLTQADTLRACLDQLHRSGRGVQCPLVFYPAK